MNSLADYINLVKGQVDFHRAAALRVASDPRRESLHLRTAAAFDDLLSYLGSQQEKSLIQKHSLSKQLYIDDEDLEGLPDELKAELNITENDKTELAIKRIVDQVGGVISLDKLLVRLYKDTGEIMKRNTLTSRLYRMSQRRMMYSVPGKKGIYSNRELSEEEVKKLFEGSGE